MTKRNPLIQKQIKSLTGGSVQSVVNTKDIADLLIPVPPLEKQKEIADFISYFNKKIKVNKAINKNLEEIILEIFDRWFVKFELSDELKSSKLGLIPKGWDIDYLGSKKSCTIIGSGIRNFEDSKIYIATADVDNSIITYNENLITMEDKPSRANMQPVPKSIWFAKMIDSRKLIMVDEYSSELLDNYIFSTGFCGLKCVDKYFYYLWTFLLTDAFNTMKNNFCTGTTMQAINNKDTKLIEFVLPDDNLLSQFNSIAEPIFKEIYYNNNEIKKLQNLRDILLPKLMSGEIDVSKINYDLTLRIMKFILNPLNYLNRGINMKTKIISKIQNQMKEYLNPDQYIKLTNSLLNSLQDVDIIDNNNELCEKDNFKLLDLFLSAKQVEGRSPKTITYYKSTIEKMLVKIKKQIYNINTDDLRKYLFDHKNEKQSSKTTIDNIRRILSSFFSWLEDEDYILKNPVRRIHKVKTGRTVKEVLTDESPS